MVIILAVNGASYCGTLKNMMMVLAIEDASYCGIFKSVRVHFRFQFACEKARLKIKRYHNEGNRGVLFWKELIFHVVQWQIEVNMIVSNY